MKAVRVRKLRSGKCIVDCSVTAEVLVAKCPVLGSGFERFYHLVWFGLDMSIPDFFKVEIDIEVEIGLLLKIWD